MNTPIKLSVSSILLAGILTGCSQHQIKPSYSDDGFHGGAQISTGYAKRQLDPRVVYKWRKQVAILKAEKMEAYHKMDRHEDVPAPQKTPIKNIKKHPNIGMPPAKAGQCYVKVKKPAAYKTLTKKIRLSNASSRRVFVRGAQYKWISKKVLVRPASYTQRIIPAVYRTVKKRVMVKPSHYTWQKGKGKITRIDHATGEILCRVKIPATYKTIVRKVLVRKAQTLKTSHPAVYKTVKQKKQVAPAQFKTVKTPARYKTKQYRVKTASARYVWKEIVCKNKPIKKQAMHHIKTAYKVKPHTLKQRKIKPHKVKRYVKKYTPTPRVKRKAIRKASYSRKMLSAHQTRRVVKPRYLKKVSYKKPAYKRKVQKNANYKKASYKKIVAKKRVTPRKVRVTPRKVRVTPRKVRVSKTYKPRVAIRKNVSTPAKAVTKPVRAKTTHKAKKANKKVNKKVRLTKQNAILRIQTALRARGFNPGKVDGKLGPATVSALTAFQRKNGLATGKLNRATLRALQLI